MKAGYFIGLEVLSAEIINKAYDKANCDVIEASHNKVTQTLSSISQGLL